MAGEIRFRDRAVYLPAADALVVADTHVGRDRTSNVQLPMGERSDLLGRLGDLLDRFQPAETVVAGDLLHAFDRLPRGVEETVRVLRDSVGDAGANLVVTPGNHDARIGAICDGPAPDAHRLADGETVVCHGHELPDVDARRYVVGHDHPAIEIEGTRRPCYLVGPHPGRDATVVVLPAFNRLAAGTTVNGASGGDTLSPLVRDLDRFRPVVRDEDTDDTLEFPPLGEFRELL